MLCASGRLLVRSGLLTLLLFTPAFRLHASDTKPDTPKPGGPTDPKARKTYQEAEDWLKARNPERAIDTFRKAAQQDGHCMDCINRAYKIAITIGDYKQAEETAREWLSLSSADPDRAAAHYGIGIALQRQGIYEKKEKCFDESCGEFKNALQLDPGLNSVHYAYGISLAHLNQDVAARSQFAAFLDQDKASSNLHERAQRYLDRTELARARMAPPFSITTLDNRHISLDSLAGKVVIVDFWATWCGPCIEALPHIREIAQRFQEQPLVVISISLDKDEGKWKDFIAKNQMTWLQYRDASFTGPIARAFGVHAIPATFTIDADGVLEDQHIGDASIEGKLKKLIAAANETAHRKTTSPALEQRPAQTTSEEKPPAGMN
jgi:thiol-disulfide isomerase/thioredoxin